MNSTLAIAQRELIEKRFVFVAAAAFLALALIIPFMPSVRAGERSAAFFLASWVLASIFALGLSAILGSSIVGREMSDGRLSFYFSKPLPATSIWWGKLIAAGVLIFGCFVMIGLPALMTAGGVALGSWMSTAGEMMTTVAAIIGTMVALFLLTHVIGTFIRSRSAWFLFDFIAVSVCGMAIWMLGRPLLMGFAVELTKRLALILGVFAALAIIAAGAWQIARGRTDRRRSHMELSRFLWASLGSGLLVMAAYVGWVVSAAPRDIAFPDLAQPSTGSWALVGGLAKNRVDYHTSFLYNIDDGRFVRIPRMHPWWPAFFSQNGNVLCWIVESKSGNEVWYANPASRDPHPIQTQIALNTVRSFNVSPDGSRLIVIDRNNVVSVDDLQTGKSFGSVRIGKGNAWFGFFVNPDVIRVYSSTDEAPVRPPATIFEYDIARKALSVTGELPPGGMWFSRDLSRVLLSSSAGLEVRDSRTGALQQRIAGRFGDAKLLDDGRVAAIGRDTGTLTIVSKDGTARVIALPNVKAGALFPTSSGPLVACGRSSCAVVDIDRGAVIRTESGIQPASHRSSGSRFLSWSHGRIVVWNPVTGEKRPIS